MKHLPHIGLCAAWLLAAGCQCNDDPSSASLSHNVGESFAGCKESEIRFLSGKHNVQLVFAPCGANAFSAYRWSPDGLRIYFQLVLSAYVMDANAENKATTTVPTPAPIGAAEWMNAATLAIPVTGRDNKEGARMAIFELPTTPDEPGSVMSGQLVYHDLPGLAVVNQLQRGDSPTDLLFAASPAADAPLVLYRMDTAAGTFEPAFSWLTVPFTTFTYTSAQHALLLGHDNQVWMVDTTTGQEVGRWPEAKRGSLHRDGRWLALELDGPPTSIYFQRTWDELSDQARERELARAERFADGLPEWSPREVRPPTLSMVDRTTNKRWAFTAFQGDQFQWYEATGTWASFFVWGFEGKQLKRNVAFADFADRLRSIDEDAPMMGVLPFDHFMTVGSVPRQVQEE
jgi:hypothetical protein